MIKKIIIIDYGLGNILSIKNAVNHCGHNVIVTSERKIIESASHIILPGVGAFPSAMRRFKDLDLMDAIHKAKKRKVFILGICLGMQIMMSKGYEHGEHSGLNLIEGEVKKIVTKEYEKLPNIGWKKLYLSNKGEMSFLEKYNLEKFYFIHSYQALVKSEDNVIGVSKYYDEKIICAVKDKKNIIGFQFHPEKSGEVGMSLLNDLFKYYL